MTIQEVILFSNNLNLLKKTLKNDFSIKIMLKKERKKYLSGTMLPRYAFPVKGKCAELVGTNNPIKNECKKFRTPLKV